MDGSFHTPEWHAARLANLKTSHTVTWEEFKKKQKVSISAFPHALTFSPNTTTQTSLTYLFDWLWCYLFLNDCHSTWVGWVS